MSLESCELLVGNGDLKSKQMIDSFTEKGVYKQKTLMSNKIMTKLQIPYSCLRAVCSVIKDLGFIVIFYYF